MCRLGRAGQFLTMVLSCLCALAIAIYQFMSDSTSSGLDVDSDTDFSILNNFTVLLCHINIHSLLPSFDEVREFLSSLARPVIWAPVRLSCTLLSHLVKKPFLVMLFTEETGVQGEEVYWFMWPIPVKAGVGMIWRTPLWRQYGLS